jgi:hypothetical protein
MLIPFRTDAPIYYWPFATVGLIVVNTLAFFALAASDFAGAEVGFFSMAASIPCSG